MTEDQQEDKIEFWIEMDEKGHPTGGICFACCPDDKPLEGNWIKVREV